MSHGYRFVGKGTVEALVPFVFHEGLLHQHMAHLQGTAIPVHLGILKLAAALRLGAARAHCARNVARVRRRRGVARARARRGTAGAARRRARWPRCAGPASRSATCLNKHTILWNAETQRAMIIDFEHADRVQDSTANGVTPASPAAAALSYGC